jgi:hypothetical protein
MKPLILCAALLLSLAGCAALDSTGRAPANGPYGGIDKRL